MLDEELDIYPDSYLVATSKMKEFIGRTVGGIAKKYYEAINQLKDCLDVFLNNPHAPADIHTIVYIGRCKRICLEDYLYSGTNNQKQ